MRDAHKPKPRMSEANPADRSRTLQLGGAELFMPDGRALEFCMSHDVALGFMEMLTIPKETRAASSRPHCAWDQGSQRVRTLSLETNRNALRLIWPDADEGVHVCCRDG